MFIKLSMKKTFFSNLLEVCLHYKKEWWLLEYGSSVYDTAKNCLLDVVSFGKVQIISELFLKCLHKITRTILEPVFFVF